MRRERLQELGMPPKFFLTHSWKDNVFARRLCDDLIAQELGGFFDVYSIKPGDSIPAEISRGLENCDIYLPILSHAALESPWCDEEINTAIMLSKERDRNGRPKIIPILVEDCAAAMPAILRHRLYIRFANSYDNALKELLTKAFGVAVTSSGQELAVSRSKRKQESEKVTQFTAECIYRGNGYSQKGALDQALAEYTKAIERDSSFVIAYDSRANIYLRKGELERALADYNKIIEIDPKWGYGYCQRGIAYKAKGDLDRALADFTEAIHLKPKFAEAYLNRGLVYRDKKLAALAIADFETYIRLVPKGRRNAQAKQFINQLRQ